MGLVQNLKKILTESGKIILQGLLSHYIKQVAKQTSKRRDNSLSTEFSPNLLTTESQGTTIATSSADTSEKTTMNTTTEEIVGHLRDWSLERAADKSVSRDDARSILEEFYEWIDPEDDEIEIYSFESKD
jgi:hypothetical protein